MCFFKKKVPLANIYGNVKKALLVGICAYPIAPLYGCRTDVLGIKKFLIEQCGFDEANILILLDGAATTKAILAGIQWLRSDLKGGDTIVFWYSGHGVLVPDPANNSELCSAICPIEFDWTPEKMIIDKQLIKAFANIPPGVIFNWGSDSCHSAGLDRDMPPPVGHSGFFRRLWRRFFGSPLIQRPKSIQAPPHIAFLVRKAKAAGAIPVNVAEVKLDVGFLSACESGQTAADTEIDGVPWGAMTYYFLQEVNKDILLINLCAKINEDLKKENYDQRPCCDGPKQNEPWGRIIEREEP